jgi:hypothetical protein
VGVDAESPRVQAGYEVANALGRLNADKPFIGQRCTEVVTYARALRYLINAIHLYRRQSGATYDQIAHDIRRGRIEVRYDGNRIVVVTP